MLDALPALQGGCINYWEAGNWALNDQAAHAGPKIAEDHRCMRLHVLGRSRNARHPDWRWGESPRFPDFANSTRWAAGLSTLTPLECDAVVKRLQNLLQTTFPLLRALP